jgi:hypothetical protein
VILDKRMLALVALSDQRRGHGFLNNMAQRDLAILVGFFASERYVRLLVAQSTTCFTTLLILTAEFLVHLDWRTLHLEVAEGTFR